jgi:N-hydroxyarylamine O-acetyltransferase
VLDAAPGELHRRSVIDLDAYFARIGYRGPRTPTLETLHALSTAHVQTIPFENLDILLGRAIDLEPAAVERKLIQDRRGGYCFEQNSLLLHVLTQLGFDAHPLSARVRYQRPRDFTPSRTHLLVRVELDESWLADVGVGGLSLTAPLRLAEAGPQTTPHDTRRLVRENGVLFHQILLGDAWHDVYELTLEEMPPIDRIVANWYTSTHPASHFRSRLTVARALPDGGRLTVVNRELTIRRRDGSAEHHVLTSPDELLAVLAERFDLRFPPGTRFSCDALDWPTA